MANTGSTVLIIGGGMIGAVSAYYLNKAGYSVTIVEKDAFGEGCSLANCGLICPSHVLPLCVPEKLTKPFKSMFSPYAPFYVNPMVGPSLWNWLMRFALNCRPSKTLEAATARHTLLQSSMVLLKELLETETIECDWRQDGLLFVHTDPKTMEHYAKTNDYLTEHFGVSAKRYNAKEVVELEPALKDTVAGGWHYEDDAQLRPDMLLPELKRILTDRGVKIVEQCTVNHIRTESGMAVGVETSGGEMACDQLIPATGAVAPKLARDLGVRLHIQPGKGYSITTDRPDPCPRIPMILEDHSVALASYESSFRLASTMEFGGYNDKMNRRRLGLLEDGARHYLRDVRGETIEHEWYGWRPMSDTGVPTIGRAPRYANAYLATGHSMLGIAMATGTGKLVTELIAGDEPHIDPVPYEPR